MSVPLVAGDPLLGGQPCAVCCLLCAQPSGLGSRAQRAGGQALLLVDQAGQRHQPSGSGQRWHHELVEVVGHRAGDQFAEGSVVAAVSLAHRFEVLGALVLEHDRGRIAETDQQKVDQQPPGAAVAIEVGVHLFEVVVNLREALGQRVIAGVAQLIDLIHPVAHRGVDLGER